MTINEIKEELKEQIRGQIRYIAVNGCSKVKCRNCALKDVCPREPVHSKEFARAVIKSGNKKE